jgi:hypothetical protein
VIAPHATPAAAYAALADFLTEGAPPLMAAEIVVEYDYCLRSVVSYTAKIHVTESVFPVWLDRHGFADTDIERTARSDGKDTLSVTSDTGVRIFCLTPKRADGGAA